VSNLIKLKPAVAASDIKRKIEEAFKRNAEIEANRTEVKTSDGEVILGSSSLPDYWRCSVEGARLTGPWGATPAFRRADASWERSAGPAFSTRRSFRDRKPLELGQGAPIFAAIGTAPLGSRPGYRMVQTPYESHEEDDNGCERSDPADPLPRAGRKPRERKSSGRLSSGDESALR
jgi:hypothetical protein